MKTLQKVNEVEPVDGSREKGAVKRTNEYNVIWKSDIQFCKTGSRF